MWWIAILTLSAPFACMILLLLMAFLQGVKARASAGPPSRRPLRRTGATYALGAAFLCFSAFYHPRLELATNAQVQQDEQADQNDLGAPDTPIRHLLRQLRRIRCGEPVEHLVWRLE